LEYLERAEQRGLLCRDDAIGGLRFFPNLFLEQYDDSHDDSAR
jgi:hypothetical protein